MNPIQSFARKHSQEQIEANVLLISRIATAGILIGSAVLAWMLRNGNIALVLWIGGRWYECGLSGAYDTWKPSRLYF